MPVKLGDERKNINKIDFCVFMELKKCLIKGERYMKKRIGIVRAALLLTSSVLAGCGSGGTSQNSDEGGKTKVTMAVWVSGAASRYDQIAENFNKTHDDIEFTVEMQSGDYNQYLGNKKAANDLPDLFYLSSFTQLQEFAASGSLADLSDCAFADKIYDSAKAAVTYDDKIYGFPEMYEYWGILYNYDLFEQAGITEIPKTFDELKEVCEKLDAAGITPFSAMYKDAWVVGQEFCALQGGAIDNGNADAIQEWISEINSGNGSFEVDGTDRVFEFIDLLKEYSGNNYMDADSSTGYDTFANEKAAMNFLSDAALIGVSNVTTDLDIGYFAVPMTDNPEDPQLVGGPTNAIVVNEDSKNKEAAMEVLDWISSGEENSWLSIAEGYYGAPLACLDYEAPEEVTSLRYYQDLMQYINAGKTRSTLFNELLTGASDEIGNIVQGYYAGMKDKDRTLEELDSKFKEMAAQ